MFDRMLKAGHSVSQKMVAMYLRNAAIVGRVNVIEYIVKRHGDDPEIMNAAFASDHTPGQRGATPLHLAVRKGQPAAVRALLKASSIDVNAVDYDWDQNTPLLGAVILNEVASADALAKKCGVDVNKFNAANKTALMIASTNRNTVREMIKIRGIQVNAVDHDLRTALHHACMQSAPLCLRTGVVYSLLQAQGIDMNARDCDGWTPMMYAARQGHFLFVLHLLAAGADKSLTNNDGQTAAQIAAAAGNARIVELIKSFVATKQQDPDKPSPPLFFEPRRANSRVSATTEDAEHRCKPDYSL